MVLVPTQVPGDSQVRQHVVIPVKTMLMLLATIDENRVDPAVKPVLIKLQDEVQDVIGAYYAKGAVINPRVTEEQLPGVIDQAIAAVGLAEARIRMLGTAVSCGLLDEQWAKTKTLVQVSRELGEAPQIEPAELPLYVEDFMHSKGVSKTKTSRFSGAFGKKVLSQAAAEGVAIPGKRTQETLDGSIREITAWTNEHLP